MLCYTLQKFYKITDFWTSLFYLFSVLVVQYLFM